MPAKEGTARRRQAPSGWVPGLGLGVHFKGQGLGGGGDGLAEQCWGSGPWSQLIQHQSTGRSSSVEGVGEGGGGGAPGQRQRPGACGGRLRRGPCRNTGKGSVRGREASVAVQGQQQGRGCINACTHA